MSSSSRFGLWHGDLLLEGLLEVGRKGREKKGSLGGGEVVCLCVCGGGGLCMHNKCVDRQEKKKKCRKIARDH